ncbi:MAG: Fic family protein, partial [Hyphomicrobium sp.]
MTKPKSKPTAKPAAGKARPGQPVKPRPHPPAHHPAQPYNGLPLLPPLAELETKAILKRCVAARSELAELRVSGQLIPDDSVLINAIPMLEARASSEIENIVTTNDSLFREASLGHDNPAGDPAAKEALRYRTALHQGFTALSDRPLTARIAIDTCRTITGTDLDVRATPGTTLKNRATGEVIYTPPESAPIIRDLLGNWERYVNADSDVDPLIRMAVLHYQFEAIHPFSDGNGRTGRILNLLFLIQTGLLDKPTLYLSRHILRTRAEYYDKLARVTRDAAWEEWIIYMLTAVEQTARWTNAKVHAIRALMQEAATYLRATRPRLYSRELVELLFTQPYCRIENLTANDLGNRTTASNYLKQLVAIGMLEEEKVWRDKVFINRKYLDLLSSEGHDFE